MFVKRFAVGLALVAIVAGCSASAPEMPAPTAPPEEPPHTASPVLPPAPTPTPAPTPAPPRDTGRTWLTATSPDEQWVARFHGPALGDKGIAIEPAQAGQPWVVEPNAQVNDGTHFLWTSHNTLLFYRRYGNESRDTWLEADPVSRKITPFVPGLLSDHEAAYLSFSPNGQQLLAVTGNAYVNKPSEVSRTTYLIDMTTQQWREVGVDVDARWDGDQLRVTSQAPHSGYSGIIFNEFDAEGTIAVTRTPLRLGLQVGAAESAEYRIYRAEAKPDDPPLRKIPAFNIQGGYSTWSFWWGDAPTGLMRIELWAEVRPAVADSPEFRREGGKRWAVVWSHTVQVKPGDQPRQTVLLRSSHMTDEHSGWGVDTHGRILRTADGGATWRDVSPRGVERCAARLSPRQAETFANDHAAVALACDSTNAEGKWSELSGRVTLFHTTDGGQTWLESQIDTGYPQAKAAAVAFLDDQRGWVLVQPTLPVIDVTNEGALYRTVDGGRTWQKVSDTSSGLPSARWEASFLTSGRGWVPGADMRSLYITEDGGRNWGKVAFDRSGLPDDQPLSVTVPQFVSSTEGFFTAGDWSGADRQQVQALYVTTDGGRTWTKRSTRNGYGNPVFLTAQVGYIWAYEERAVYWTRDGGNTWEPRRWEINPAGMTDVHFVNEERGFAVQGYLWTSGDGARTWVAVYPNLAP